MLLTALSAAWVIGVSLGTFWRADVMSLLLFVLASLSLAVLLRRFRTPWALAFFLPVLLFGMVRSNAPGASSGVALYDDGPPVEIRGVVVGDPELRAGGVRLHVSARSVDSGDGWRPTSGTVLVLARPAPGLVEQRAEPYLRYGDELLLRGRLVTLPVFEDFDYREYMARQGVLSAMYYPRVELLGEGQGSRSLRWLYALRHRLAVSLEKALPEPHAALAEATLVGVTGGLASQVAEDFRRTGTSHILAISGLNVGIVLVVALALGQLAVGRRRWLYLLALAFIWAYAFVSGFSPSVERAAIMGSMYLVALFLGRESSAVPSLALAASVMVGLAPNVLWDISFQLSFTAMLGMALLAPVLSPWARMGAHRLAGDQGFAAAIAEGTATTLAITLAAILGTLPLMAFNFRQVPLTVLPANLLALPAVPAALLASAATALVGLVSAPVAQVVGWLAWAPLAYLLWVVHLFALVPGAALLVGGVSGALVWGYYAVLLLLPEALRRVNMWLDGDKTPPSSAHASAHLRISPPALVYLGIPVLLALGVAVVWSTVLSERRNELEVVFLDVGQGDAVFIRSPQGHRVLVDGGPNPHGAVQALGGLLLPWDKRLDMVVLTHPHDDHVTGLVEVARRYQVKQAMEPYTEYVSSRYSQWRKALADAEIPLARATEGQEIRLGSELTLYVLNPPSPAMGGTSEDVDNNAIVLKVVYRRVSFLLTSDVHREAEVSMQERGVDFGSTVLKVAHHGSDTSTTQAFLDAVGPSVAVISVGKDNPFGHPRAGTMETLKVRLPAEGILLTSEHGNITFLSDGATLRVRAER